MPFLHVINTLAPVFLIIAAGVLMRRSGFLALEHFYVMNRLAYWVGMPALLFHKIAGAPLATGETLRLFLVMMVAMLSCVAVGYALAALMRLTPNQTGAFVQGAFRGNLAFVGLPVLLFSSGSLTGGGDGGIEAMGFVILAPMIALQNVTAVVVLLRGRHAVDRRALLKVGGSLLTNPLLLACAAGLAYAAAGLALPVVVERTCRAVGHMALPLALLGIGGSLGWASLRGNLAPAGLAALVKLAWSPLAGLIVARWVGLTPDQTRIVLILLATPTAASAYMIAQQMGGDERIAAGCVPVSSALSIFSLGAVLLLA